MEAFGWSAEQFWVSTPHEFWAMIDARKGANKALQQR